MFNDYINLYDDNDYICIQQIEKDKPTFPLFYRKKEFISLSFDKKVNMYFTPNTFNYRYVHTIKKGNINRETKYMNTIHALYADIDLKEIDTDVPITQDEVLNYLKKHIFGSELPDPTMVVSSGNGIHVYWKLQAVNYKGNINKWLRMQNYIHDCLKSFGADTKVKNDTVRLLRIPGTINVKENKKKCCYVMEQDLNAIYHLDVLVKEFCKTEIVISSKSNKKDKTVGTTAGTKNKSSGNVISIHAPLIRKRVDDLENLLINYRDYVGSGREYIEFLYRYYQCILTRDKDMALARTIKLNTRLKHPLSEKEVIQNTKSANKYYDIYLKDGKGYKRKNSFLIEKMDIKESEMKSMVSFVSHAIQKERTSRRKRGNYIASLKAEGKLTKRESIIIRQQNIYKLLMQRKKEKEICQVLNISRSTYFSDTKIIKTQEWIKSYKELKFIAMDRSMEREKSLKTGTDDTTESIMTSYGLKSPENFPSGIKGICTAGGSSSVEYSTYNLILSGLPPD